jgi:2-polyprenyl-6-methoxyphenol hydroxylase-like FAD-dependent oxidoreductase
VKTALRTYESKRLKRANKIVSQSWRIGQVIQMENALVCKLRNAVMRLTPASIQRQGIKWIIEHEV